MRWLTQPFKKILSLPWESLSRSVLGVIVQTWRQMLSSWFCCLQSQNWTGVECLACFRVHSAFSVNNDISESHMSSSIRNHINQNMRQCLKSTLILWFWCKSNISFSFNCILHTDETNFTKCLISFYRNSVSSRVLLTLILSKIIF